MDQRKIVCLHQMQTTGVQIATYREYLREKKNNFPKIGPLRVQVLRFPFYIWKFGSICGNNIEKNPELRYILWVVSSKTHWSNAIVLWREGSFAGGGAEERPCPLHDWPRRWGAHSGCAGFAGLLDFSAGAMGGGH